MSLQQAAQHLAAQGRGKDTTLVHMTPNEVRGLQQIAMAAGGSLSVNPSTGLPEAGFLEDMLPMIIGAGLIAATGGAAAPGVLAGITPGMIGLGVGGIQALRTGNLMEGVKAGLGAYGGAGLATGLIGAGASDLAGVNIANEATMATGPGSAAYEGISIPDGYKQLAAQTATPEQIATARAASTPVDLFSRGASSVIDSPSSALNFAKANAKSIGAAAAPAIASALEPGAPPPVAGSDANMGQRYSYSAGPTTPFPQPNVPRAGSPEQFQSFGKEQRYFTPGYTKIGADQAKSLYGFAEGGETTIKYDPGKQQYEIIKQGQSRSPTTQELVNASVGSGRVDSDGGGGDGIAGSSGSSMGFGHGIGAISAGQALSSYGNAFGGLAPGGMLAGMIGAGMLASGINSLGEAEAGAHSMGGDFAGHAGMDAGSFGYGGDAGWGAGDQGGWGGDAGGYGGDGGGDGGGGGGDGGGGEANGGLMHAYAAGGGYNLGDYSDGGRLLRGPGDGVSDSIPATIGKKQPARLADGEFVVPARIVSELGNGSTEAGARKLYAMMNRIQSARGKTVGKGKVAKNSRAERHLPA
jgi:hypothetical protein